MGSFVLPPERCLHDHYVSKAIVAITKLWILVGALSVQETSKAHFMDNVERTGRVKRRPLNCSLPVLSLDAKDL